jgi:outer membrane protein assembly factor BamB
MTPMVIGYTNEVSEGNVSAGNYDSYHVSETHENKKDGFVDYNNKPPNEYSYVFEIEEPFFPSATGDGPMDSPWPMYCHDTYHTGRSPYSTADNTGYEKWRCKLSSVPYGDVVIDDNETIYIGANGLYAVYPNGTLKWKYITHYIVDGAPAIDEYGTIYFGTIYGSPSYLYALYANGTLKWKYSVGGVYSIFSSPAIGDDGTIYFGSGGDYPPTGRIKALYPNGTLKWEYETTHVVYSSPAIGEDGTIYCGCHDTYLYALYPSNGTLKWKYKTGDWIRTSPCISDDGTIYVVSLDSYLHAVNPDSSFKWKTNVGAGTSPTIGQDGTIYCGYNELYAIKSNGSVKWKLSIDGKITGATPCNSIDGTIYFGNYDGSAIVAVNPDGTEKWRKSIGGDVESAPAIGEDGTVYIGDGMDDGYLHAFGIGELEADANGPYYGLVDIPVQFEGKATGGYSPHSYHWDFGDTHTSDEQNPLHTYTAPGNYTGILTVIDDTGNTSDDITWAWIQDGNSPPDKPMVDGQTHGIVGVSYDYTFCAIDPDENDIWYHIGWGDKEIIYIYGPYQSGKEITLPYTWSEKGIFTITCWARDVYDEVSEAATLEVTMPRNRANYNMLFLRFLEQFPIIGRFISRITNPLR